MDFDGDSPFLQALGRLGVKIYDEMDLVQMYIHLLFAALFPIYIGAHASLRRPPMNVTKDPKKVLFQGTSADDDDEDDDEESESSAIEGLTPSDAIMFPILAGFTLGGLYFLIKWLNDPAIISRILGYYFSTIGVFGIGKLAGDGLNVITTFVFPTVWSSGKDVHHVDPLLRQQFIGSASPSMATRGGFTHRKFSEATTPLPGLLAKFGFSARLSNSIWTLREVFTGKWIFKAYVHGIASLKTRVRLNDIIGMLLGLLAIVLYNFNGKAWWLTNLMGTGFCYGTLQLMSPTTFWTGSLVLMGLFVYDIIMVFYTPMMVKVATTLDVPIKLVFPGPKRGGMLGLGDVVLPGIMVALALRFDLYMFYLKKKRAMEAAAAAKPAPDPGSVEVVFNFQDPSADDEREAKPVYHAATGFQGERFWTASSISSILPFPFSLLRKAAVPGENVPPSVTGGMFPKTYFWTSIVGYIIGMLTTLYVLNVYQHAQPALLYLVPGVLLSLWGTSFARGEFKEMWGYVEDGGILEDLKGGGSKDEKSEEKKDAQQEGQVVEEKVKDTPQEVAVKIDEENKHHVFLISLSKPKKGAKKAKLFEAKPQ